MEGGKDTNFQSLSKHFVCSRFFRTLFRVSGNVSYNFALNKAMSVPRSSTQEFFTFLSFKNVTQLWYARHQTHKISKQILRTPACSCFFFVTSDWRDKTMKVVVS